VQYHREAFADVDRTVNFQEREAFGVCIRAAFDSSRATPPDIISVRQYALILTLEDNVTTLWPKHRADGIHACRNFCVP
jgi:hypothetical protein